MKFIFTLASGLILAMSVFSQETGNSARFNASASLNSNGIASIPAFSLGKPALIANLSVSKGRFSYDPVLAYSMDLKPWFLDSWLHYRIIKKTSFELRTGFNFSNFFTQFDNEPFVRGERYFAGELAGIYRISSRTTLSLMYWSDNGMEKGTISGHYVSLMGEINDVPVGNRFLFGAALQLFYINYDGNNDGFFTCPRLSWGIRNFPLSVFFQATQVINSNVEPDPGFKWNAGLNYTFR